MKWYGIEQLEELTRQQVVTRIVSGSAGTPAQPSNSISDVWPQAATQLTQV